MRSTPRSFAVGIAVPVGIPVSQANQRAGEGVAGAEAETDESGAAAKAMIASTCGAVPTGVPTPSLA